MFQCYQKLRLLSQGLCDPVVSEILCYTHTYAGQALAGEVVEARGMMEDVRGQKRLVVGTSREPVGEWMRSLNLLGRVPQPEK